MLKRIFSPDDCIPYGGRPCKNLIGSRVGNTTVIGYLGKITADVANEYWLVQCNNCHSMRPVRADYFRSKKRRMLHCYDRSCGAKFNEQLKAKGLTKHQWRFIYLREKKHVDTSSVEA